MPAVTHVRIENVTPARLVDLVRSGRMRLPSFQGAYRWRPADVESLFDSVVRRYPIGNLVLWERPAPADRITLGPLVLDVPETPRALWVVDGQQRITSLVGALAAPDEVADPRFGVYVRLPTLEFRAASRPPPGPWLPVRCAASPQRLIRWQRENAELLGEEEYAAADELVAALREYAVPSYIVEADDERELRVVFDRVNNYGHPLREEEVFDALHGVQGASSRGDLGAVEGAVAAAGFGRVPDLDVLGSLVGLRDLGIFGEVHGGLTDDADRRNAFLHTERVLLEVVTVLRDDLDVPHVRVLPYPSVIPLLATLVQRFGRPTGRVRLLLRRWLWRGATLGGDVRPLHEVLRVVAEAGTAHDAVLVLLDALPRPSTRWTPDLAQVQLEGPLARVNMLGLIDLAPRELLAAATELPVRNPALSPGELFDTVTRPLVPIVPPTVSDPLTATVANCILHPPLAGGVDAALLAADAETRRTHGVDPEGADLLAAGRWDEFLARRAALLRHTIADLVDRHAEWGARDRFSAAELVRAGRLGA